MQHLGDITKIDGGRVEPVDVVIGGSPCQDLSIAGHRAGLAGERSGLYMEQIRVVKELREADVRRGRTGQLIRPRFMVWENVPGAFSSNKGEDFRAVLEEAVRIVEPEAVIPGHAHGWRTSGAMLGDGWSLAWRVLDAQFWGVPQRRRRIALVVDLGGYAAPEVLFVRKSVSGDIDQGQAAGEATAPGAGGGAGPAVARSLTARHDGSPCVDRGPNIVLQPEAAALRMRSGCEGGGKGALIQVEKSGTLGCANDQTIFTAAFKSGQGAAARGIGYAQEVSPALTAAESGSNRAPCVLSVAENQRNELRVAETCPAKTSGGGKPGQGCPCVYENHGQDGRLTGPVDPAPTVAGKYGTGGNNTPLVVATGQSGAEIMADCSTTLNCNHEQPIVAHTLMARANLAHREDSDTLVFDGPSVRRLTPLECERLQGFPDGWTDIGPWTDSKGKVHKESSDSARYKALGNSIALPPWRWVLLRLSALYERPATLGSLFDGIGGFPLLWERFNGPGSCLWASEIEEFPMAVTRARFGDWEGR